ncbi:hypothetical protein C6Y14_42965 [Streptomyces dioscori]|uniref:Uncharacterized protein n=1 Tax=Streptomyces dioscori TaxID=2109333 RepID=A0A2P8PTD6_9ACTN|nr:hypothetical protein C6Y14_42965 [Streptomyces dioscori]
MFWARLQCRAQCADPLQHFAAGDYQPRPEPVDQHRQGQHGRHADQDTDRRQLQVGGLARRTQVFIRTTCLFATQLAAAAFQPAGDRRRAAPRRV